MNPTPHADQAHDLDESSWVYLSLGPAQRAQRDLPERVIAACEASGWPAVSWSPRPHKGNVLDSARFFEGMSHAVEHADAVIVLISDPSAMVDIELAFAYSHNRPVVGLRIGDQGSSSEMQSMLHHHSRARVVDCASVDECVDALHTALSDPQFGATIREAAGERAGHV